MLNRRATMELVPIMPRSSSSRPKKPVKSASANSAPQQPSAFEKAMHELKHQHATAYPNISPRWLVGAAAVVVTAALICGWLALCLLYWQGSWQLLYHPAAAITATPAKAGLSYEPIHFAAKETGETQLTGWWLPSPGAGRTVLYLHGADGNLSGTVETLAALHAQNLAVFAIDYRGYGQSGPGRPTEKLLRQDAEWALTWLTVTRGFAPKTIVIYGSGLGANMAAELAADHGEVAGVVLDQPLPNAMAPVFNDSRSRLVPARWLVKDRFDLTAAAQSLKIPSLWLLDAGQLAAPAAYAATPGKKTEVWLKAPKLTDPNFAPALTRWLDDL